MQTRLGTAVALMVAMYGQVIWADGPAVAEYGPETPCCQLKVDCPVSARLAIQKIRKDSQEPMLFLIEQVPLRPPRTGPDANKAETVKWFALHHLIQKDVDERFADLLSEADRKLFEAMSPARRIRQVEHHYEFTPDKGSSVTERYVNMAWIQLLMSGEVHGARMSPLGAIWPPP